MSEYTDKLQEWVDSVMMCEAEGIEPCYKHCDVVNSGRPTADSLYLYSNRFIFPIAVIDGKPVFVGDELWLNGVKIVVMSARQENGTRLLNEWCVHHWSWNPPKPKNTVMVEMLVEDAASLLHPAYPTLPQLRISEACRKALEEMK